MRLGILGAGQLGRMLALAARPLGIDCLFLDPAEQACAADVGRRFRAAYDDEAVLRALADACDFISYEFENVPVEAVRRLASRTVVRPGEAALHTAQDRLREKEHFRALGIPVADFLAVDDAEALKQGVAQLGLPCVLKTRRMGYDGKGQAVLRQPGDVEAAWAQLGGQPLLLERWVAFDREVSIVAVRAADGSIAAYPLSENDHRHGVLWRARPRLDDPLQPLALRHVSALMQDLDYVGVLSFEFFAVAGELLANEIAPRVHNSGHWSIEASECSQFENHVRAVCDLPLGETRLCAPHSVMYNLLGEIPDRRRLLQIQGLHLHDYEKSPVPGRKVGHVTLTAGDAESLADREARLQSLLAEAGQDAS